MDSAVRAGARRKGRHEPKATDEIKGVREKGGMVPLRMGVWENARLRRERQLLVDSEKWMVDRNTTCQPATQIRTRKSKITG
jgi:hypothetical protein